MAERTEKKNEEKGAAAAAPAAPPAEKKAASGSFLKSTPLLLAIVMITEAAILFMGFKMLGGGAGAAQGANLLNDEGSSVGHGVAGKGGKNDPKKVVELKVLEFKAPNKQTGRTYIYDVTVYLSTKNEFKERVEQTVAAREAMIKDRIRTIIAQSDPEKLGGMEPGLETLRRQVKYQLDEIIGEGLIEEVLVPRCIPYRADL